MNFRRKSGALFLIAAAGLLHGANAEVVQYEFTDTLKKTKNVQATSAIDYLNPSGDISVTVSAGIDRKIRLTAIDSAGKTIATQTSGVVGPNDRVVANNKSYYGFVMALKLPGEGRYSVKAELLSSSNQVVQTDGYQVIVDTSPPTAGGISITSPYGGGIMADGLIAVSKADNTTGIASVSIPNILDNNSVKSIKYELIASDSGVAVKSGDSQYTENADSMDLRRTFFANTFNVPNGKYRLKFNINDIAGNISTLEREMYVNSVCPETPEFMGLYDPDSTSNFLDIPALKGFVGPTNGKNIVKNNPAKALYRVRKDQSRDFDPIWGGFFANMGVSKTVLAVDGEYAYLLMEGPVNELGNFPNESHRWTNTSTHACKSMVVPNAEIDPLQSAPEPLYTEAYIDGFGWGANTFYTKDRNVPADTKVSRLRFHIKAARGYDILVTQGKPSCVIPAGGVSCEMEVDYPFNTTDSTGVYSFNGNFKRASDGQLALSGNGRFFYWDKKSPTITSVSHAREVKEFVFYVNEPGTGSYGMGLNKGFIVAKNNLSGVVTEIAETGGRTTAGNDHTVTISYKALSDGEYTFSLRALDNYGNSVEQQVDGIYAIDSTPPVLNIVAGTSISTLDDVKINLSDALDKTPRITEVNLKGGASNENVFLTVRSLSSGNYALEYPVMFPSMKENEKYTLSIKAQDSQGNQVQKSVTFKYEPNQIALKGNSSKISIPAFEGDYVLEGGKKILETEKFTLKDGSNVVGVYDIFLTLRSDSEAPVRVNGVEVLPGETKTVIKDYNFGANESKIAFDIKPGAQFKKGVANILVSSSAPNSPIVVGEVTMWKPEIDITFPSRSIVQGIENYNVALRPETSTTCQLTTQESKAKAANNILAPICLVDFFSKPVGDSIQVDVANGVDLVGRMNQVGREGVSFALYVYDSKGKKNQVQSGIASVNSVSALGSVSLAATEDISNVVHSITDAGVRLKIQDGYKCSLTMNRDAAIQDAATRSSEQASNYCFVEWIKTPPGLVQDERSDTPYLRGVVSSEGVHPISWRVSLFTKTGAEIKLNEQSINLTAVNPPKPEILINSKSLVPDSENVLVVPMAGGYIGDVEIKSVRAALDLSIARGTEVLEQAKIEQSMGLSNNSTFRRLNADARNLWEVTKYKVAAAFTALPSVKQEVVYSVYAAPSESVKPVIKLDSDTAVNTSPMKVVVTMSDRGSTSSTYSPETMGKWKVRLVRVMTYNKREELAAPVAISETGEAVFNVDVGSLDSTALRFVAEAELESPVPGYKRVAESPQGAFVTISRGGEITSAISSRRTSGEAPFTNTFKLSIDERLDMRAVGDVAWEVSSDGGKSWVAHDVKNKSQRFMFVNVFDKGTHQVRAKVVNANSLKSKYSEPVEVIAYDKPKLVLTGAQAFYVGGTAKVTAALTLNGKPLNTGDAVVEWSVDNGETFNEGSTQFEIKQSEVSRVRLVARARSKEAPAEDMSGYSVVRKTVEFLKMKPPRVYVDGPIRVEKGKTYELAARVTPPYRDMDLSFDGEFTLPNGTVQKGTSIQYTPSDEDLASQTINVTYTAWAQGFREDGAESTYVFKTKVWEYVWPTFGLEIKRTAKVAPSEVTVKIRPIAFSGNLEEPTYSWTLPTKAVITDSSKATQRTFKILEDGVYEIGVVVKDARGHETVIKQDLAIAESAPYKVDLQYSGSNAINRAPLDVLLRPYVTGGHPLDRIDTRSFTVNGEKLDVAGHYGRITLNAGNHDVAFSIRSKMGEEAEAKVRISVKENTPPTCTLTQRETVGSWLFYASCKDEDGRMRSYEWTVDGEVKAVTGDRLTLNRVGDAKKPNVQLIGIDDAGGRSQPAALQ
ncbi:Ig-like domain-containing protein [Comamonas sp. E6]|uniref:Ig-like domain-containing protein n=1 Tax=Comamonas sp. E6 TaxID=364029 RepID=UPI0006391748|nr:Ig-like domain-containing protein [Comamonas sp. E6]GAO73605.1 hypothetical protein CSE6_048_50420 [Comamonas sp. E6]